MSDASGLSVLIGGVGLFLLGMGAMTDGLKLAAGPALGRVLGSSTQTRLRGLLSGILVTALVQSSSAVTVAAIGFVNAGLLSFGQTLWVLFGANVGTTMTGWLVALIGLKIKIEAAALTLIGLGMALHLSGPKTRRGAIGTVLTGFGVLFLGIGFMQQAFDGAGEAFDLTRLGGHGIWSTLAFVAAGTLLTVLMQSSSAALAVVLTLAETGTLPLSEAAAAVIGANIGTTVTAVLASIGATPNAHRAAAAHVGFNLVTGVVALVLLPVLIRAVDGLREAFALEASPAVSLALFHTVFNVLGVALMWPLAGRMARFLEGRFGPREATVRTRYLDRNVASVPALAVNALDLELRRLGGLVTGEIRTTLREPAGGKPAAGGDALALASAIAEFLTSLSRSSMAQGTADTLASQLRVLHYYENCAELVEGLRHGRRSIASLDLLLRQGFDELARKADRLLLALDPQGADFAPDHRERQGEFEAAYQHLKAAILAVGASDDRLDMKTMDSVLDTLSALHRATDQATKAGLLLRREANPPPEPAATAATQGT
ncbi:MAG: Na/Pi cotransporter family protein [Rhodocyclaceae bacterium]|nr:Na/Pi cotransporter family protein [Rhodocyclaceae bacterium]